MNEMQKYAYSSEVNSGLTGRAYRLLVQAQTAGGWFSLLLGISSGILILIMIPEQLGIIGRFGEFPVSCIIAACIIMPMNLMCEILKVRKALANQRSLFWSMKVVCKGFAINLFLPCGAGSLISGISSVPSAAEYLRGILAGSALQNLCNLSGAICFSGPLAIHFSATQAVFSTSHFFMSVCLCFGMLIPIAFLSFKKMDKTYRNHTATGVSGNIILHEWRTFLVPMAGLSALRYVFYLIQLVLLLSGFSSESWMYIFAVAALYYAIISMIPLPGVFTVLSRMAVAACAFPALGLDFAASVSVSGFIYLLNQVVPAMLGCCFLFNEGIRVQT